jgi:type I restriction enzyme M protein
MANGDLTWIVNFIWSIADDVLRDVYVRGKYRDVILPMLVIRRLDAVLEPTKSAVIEMKVHLDRAGITNQDAALRQAAGQAFYNASPFTLRDLRARAKAQQLRAWWREWGHVSADPDLAAGSARPERRTARADPGRTRSARGLGN